MEFEGKRCASSMIVVVIERCGEGGEEQRTEPDVGTLHSKQ